jgi:catechol 2,3-dioxygenase-like lactoylglutathione lyase family enzyme
MLADRAPLTVITIAGLGEFAFRTERLERMVAFYGDVLGFERIDDAGGPNAFFRAGDGVDGHTQVLVPFGRSADEGYTPPDVERSTVDHVAFGVSAAAFDTEAERLEALGYDFTDAYHDWVAWRSLYLRDLDGNHVELVCHDLRPADD